MGTQQLFVIILVVVIVGIAISVGLVIYRNMAYNANKQAVAAEMENFISHAVAYYELPTSMTGAGRNPSNVMIGYVAQYMGFSFSAPGNVISGYWVYNSENGEFRVLSAASGTVVIAGLGTETRANKHPYVRKTLNFTTGQVTSYFNDQTTF